ncbi:MAG: SCE4755 family polysaccharide monooxygenase-like protein [Pseudomonadota bacterium]
MRKLILMLSVPVVTLAPPASAHFNLTTPPSIAKSTEGGKGPAPCGPDTATTGTPTAVTGGKPLTLSISETVAHPGFYRFALSLVSPPQFPADNVVKDQAGMVILPTDKQATSFSAAFEDPAKFPVLADHLFVHADGVAQSFPSTKYPGEVVIPNLNCEKCTLQVIEFMANHPSNGDSAGYFYHHCALLKITADPALPIFDPNAAAGGGGAGGAGGMAGGSGVGGVAGESAGGAGGTGGSAGTASTGTAGAPGAGAPSSAGAGAGGTVSTAGSPGAAGFSPGGSSGLAGSATGTDPSSDGGCSYAPGKQPDPIKRALAVLCGVFGLAVLRRRGAGSHRG